MGLIASYYLVEIHIVSISITIYIYLLDIHTVSISITYQLSQNHIIKHKIAYNTIETNVWCQLAGRRPEVFPVDESITAWAVMILMQGAAEYGHAGTLTTSNNHPEI